MQDKIKEILERGLKNDLSESDKQKMLALFHNSDIEFELKNELLEKLNNSDSPKDSSADFDRLFNELWKKINEKEKQSKQKVRWLIPAMRIAAVLVLGIVMGTLINNFGEKEAPVYYTSNCPKGSVSSLVLPDNTIIYLNADSEVKYSIDGKDGVREVFLSGEAWFDVAKNTEKPFFVYTSTYDVEVTGTKFNVKAYEYENYVSTTLEEGEVKITASENFKLEDKLILKPGQQAVFDKEQKVLKVQDVNTQLFSSWKDNKLIFVNMSLQELQVLLERKYGVDILIKNKELLNLHFDGVIKNETIFEIMEILKFTLSIDYTIVDQRIEITERKI